MDDILINDILVYKLPLSASKFLLWAFCKFEGSKKYECVEQLTFYPATVQPMKIWHTGNNAQYIVGNVFYRFYFYGFVFHFVFC